MVSDDRQVDEIYNNFFKDSFQFSQRNLRKKLGNDNQPILIYIIKFHPSIKSIKSRKKENNVLIMLLMKKILTRTIQ